ncbi:MAG TPA: hypothetical protein VLA09_13615 [Longimicrobiales bacterium]|nr:hypothetical protein [Longimicrobiales bacterium]
MSESTRDGGATEGSGEGTVSESDYRVREVEARLERRITAIESKRARTGWATGFMAAGLAVTLAVLGVVLASLPGDGERTLESISAGEIVLRDADGVARGRLATDSDGRAELSLSDRDGRERIRLTVLADGSPGVTISDRDARPRAVLGYLADGTTNLVFADARGVSRAVFGLDPDGSTQALFADRAGTIRTLIGVGVDGVPAVSLFDEEAEQEDPQAP